MTPENAFAPGSPAGGESIAQGGTMTLPPLQFASSSSAKSGDISAQLGFDNSGFTVNYGSGASIGGAMAGVGVNPFIIVAVLIAGALWMKKKSA